MLQVMSRRVVRLEARLQTYKADMDQIQQLKVGYTACQLGFTAALSGPSAWPSHCCCALCGLLLLFLAVSLLYFIWHEHARQQDNTSLAAVQLRSEDLKVFVESLLGLCSQDQRQLAEVRQSEDSLRRELRASQAQLAGHPLQASLQSQSALTVRFVGPPIHTGYLQVLQAQLHRSKGGNLASDRKSRLQATDRLQAHCPSKQRPRVPCLKQSGTPLPWPEQLAKPRQ